MDTQLATELFAAIKALKAEIVELRDNQSSHYKGTGASDFTTTTLPHKGDYGYQTTASELQMNCNGTILKTPMTAL